jgi:hypothetical protein
VLTLFMILVIISVPDLNAALFLGTLLPIAIILPIVGYPFSKTLWIAIDRAYLQSMDSNERRDD